MRVDEERALLARALKPFALALTSLCLLASPAVFAQEDDADDENDALSILDQERPREEVVVTGSRLKRDTYSSVAPLQVISSEVSRNIGAIDPGQILQDAPSSAGTQIDLTFQGFVLDDGPGATTADLRGLGAGRTLVLINGRRAAPAGVEGAPASPDLNMVPASLVQQYDLLLDGASSIYGSDALAGVANIILRKDFDGLEIESFTTIPEHSNGVEQTISAAWGYNGDKGFIGFGADYTEGDAVARGDRPWSSGCETYREVSREGQVFTTNRLYNQQFGMKETECVISFGAQRVFGRSGLFGSLYYTPGTSNVGIPNLSEATLGGLVLDQNGDGSPDVDFTDYFIANEDNATQLIPDYNRLSFMGYGEYTFDGDMNLTPYFEFNFNKRKTDIFRAGTALQTNSTDPTDPGALVIPTTNPFNPCNPAGVGGDGSGGVDCGVSYNAVLDNPVYVEDFRDLNEALCAQFNFTRAQCVPALFGLRLPGNGAVGALPFDAQVSVRGDRTDTNVEVEQVRFVAGLKGDLPFLDMGSLSDWSFDVAVVHSDAQGDSVRTGINQAALQYSLNTSRIENGEVVCGDATGGPCVPVNLYAPSLYESLLSNDFATQAEADYLFADRTFETGYEQTYISGIITGDLFELPAGAVKAAVGYEYRNDSIDSIPNEVAAQGLLYNFFRDLGAVGEKDTEEWFAELEVPLLAGVPGFEELTTNISTRHTKDEFYGGEYTYSAKLAWRPVESLLLRATVGTSYRAPNLRENFLLGQSGFLTLSDPCVPPTEAIQNLPVTGITYVAAEDTRNQIVIDNCRAEGIDPEMVGVSPTGVVSGAYGVEILRAVGDLNLREEQSDSFTAGFSWDVTAFDGISAFDEVDINFSASYYDIAIRDEIIAQGAQGSINSCYGDAEGDSVFCSNITRDPGPLGTINEVDQQFLNRDALNARGVDLNLAVDWPVTLFDRPIALSADFNFNRKLELSDRTTDLESGDIEFDSDLGQFGVPEWEGQAVFRADFSDYRITWATRYLASVEADPDTVDAFPFAPFGNTRAACPDGLECRPVYFADNYFRHDASIYFYGDVWTIGAGVRNVFDEAPPQVDGRTVFSGWNTPFGAGYDVNGRRYFINIAASFDNLTF